MTKQGWTLILLLVACVANTGNLMRTKSRVSALEEGQARLQEQLQQPPPASTNRADLSAAR